MILNECIIIGGGKSVQEGISLGLKERIKDKFVITCNFSCYHFDSTLTTYLDKDFYLGDLNPKEINSSIISSLSLEC